MVSRYSPNGWQLVGDVAIAIYEPRPMNGQPAQREQIGIHIPEQQILGHFDLSERVSVGAGDVEHPVMSNHVSGQRR
jgi:hypothetical protein